jgi:dTDP-4-dehydrorhamnose 3,5-epimerase
MKGVSVHKLRQIAVPKGNVFLAMKATDIGYAGFGEAYFSQIEHGAVKGWKKHNIAVLNIVVPLGKIRFIIYDDRQASDTFGQFKEIILSADSEYKRLTLAPGLWMAFQGLGDEYSMLLDIISEPHTPEEADSLPLDSLGFNFL